MTNSCFLKVTIVNMKNQSSQNKKHGGSAKMKRLAETSSNNHVL